MKAPTSTLQVSVIIPAYNMQAYLAEAIKSVLNQTLAVNEIIVVDDGSSDKTAEVAASFSTATLIRQENAGAAEAMNNGVRHSSGPLIAFLDADDVWQPEKIEKQVQFLKSNPNNVALFCMVKNFISPELNVAEQAQVYCPPDAMEGIHASAMLIRREAFEQVGFFNSSFKTSHFIEWGARFYESNLKYQVLPTVLVKRRIHLTNTTRTKKEAVHQNYLKIARQIVQRRRGK